MWRSKEVWLIARMSRIKGGQKLKKSTFRTEASAPCDSLPLSELPSWCSTPIIRFLKNYPIFFGFRGSAREALGGEVTQGEGTG